MDAATLQARLDVARSFSHSIGSITFRCRLIPEFKVASIYAKYRGASGNIDAARDLLAETVTGITGATTADLYLDGPAEVIDDSKAAALMLLDDRQDLAISLASEIARRISDRGAATREDEKNS